MGNPLSQNKNQDQDDFANDKFNNVLLEVINRKLGIVVTANQLTDLHRIVEDACQKFKFSERDYLNAIKNANDDSSIMKNLISAITVGETYFFRDEKQMQLLKKTILPEIIAKKREKNDLAMRIWSAGCASGEELYSIIIMINEMLPDMHNWHLHFLGTDINAKVLHKALQGEYSEWSMRAIDDYYKNKYLKYNGRSYLLNKKIIEQAQFNYLNLNNNSFPSIINGTSALDLIICRNVLIYFDAEHIREIMKKFSSCLGEGGYLLLGASDPIELDGSDFELQVEYGKLLCKPAVEQYIHKKPADIKRVEQVSELPVVHDLNSEVDLSLLTKQSRWTELLNTVEQYPTEKYQTAEVLSAKAAALANLGRLKEAAQCCEDSLKIDPIQLPTYFTYAMILIGLHEHSRAEEALRKTLFLDRDFVLGHYQLGLLLIRNNDLEAGLKSLKNAYVITQKKDPFMSVPGYEDLTFGKLTDILQEEIQLHEVGSNEHETE